MITPLSPGGPDRRQFQIATGQVRNQGDDTDPRPSAGHIPKPAAECLQEYLAREAADTGTDPSP